MNKQVEIKIPDIGEYSDIPVIEVLVKPGEKISENMSLVTLESDKATMEVPSPLNGVVRELKIQEGDKVSEGSIILILETNHATEQSKQVLDSDSADNLSATSQNIPKSEDETDIQVDLVVLGAGPGGYTAAFRAADLGIEVLIIERYENLGGVCLNVGCIPSKALLHKAKIIEETKKISNSGITFGNPKIDLKTLRDWKNKVVAQLTRGLQSLATKRRVKTIEGVGTFMTPNSIKVTTNEKEIVVTFKNAIIAAGSRPSLIPDFPDTDSRIMDSTSALKLETVPNRLLVIGGGIIGLEMATIYHSLGAKVTIAELAGELLAGADHDLVKPLHKVITERYEAILLNTKVTKIKTEKTSLKVSMETNGKLETHEFDRILLSIGRIPNSDLINSKAIGVDMTDRGHIKVDNQMRTSQPNIYAIGDIIGEPMLAHKATYEGKIAAEVIAGKKVAFDACSIPSVAYTDPEIAWMGLTEKQALENEIPIEKSVFPWAASGRALVTSNSNGFTKLIFDKNTKKLLGAGIVGASAGELITETMLGLEMGADSEDIALTIHPHPTLSETVFFASEIAEGSITDLHIEKK